MKLFILSTIGVLCLNFCVAQSGATLYVGPTFMNFDVSDENISAVNLGYQTGLDVRIGDKSFWMLFGASYNEVTLGTSNQSAAPKSENKLKYISGKFNLEQRLFMSKKLRPTIGGGVVIDNILNTGDYFKTNYGNLSTLSLYWNAAVGLQYKSVFVRMSYEKMLHKYFFEQENPRPHRLVLTTGFFF